MPDRLLAFDAHDLVNLAAIDFRTRCSLLGLYFLNLTVSFSPTFRQKRNKRYRILVKFPAISRRLYRHRMLSPKPSTINEAALAEVSTAVDLSPGTRTCFPKPETMTFLRGLG